MFDADRQRGAVAELPGVRRVRPGAPRRTPRVASPGHSQRLSGPSAAAQRSGPQLAEQAPAGRLRHVKDLAEPVPAAGGNGGKLAPSSAVGEGTVGLLRPGRLDSSRSRITRSPPAVCASLQYRRRTATLRDVDHARRSERVAKLCSLHLAADRLGQFGRVVDSAGVLVWCGRPPDVLLQLVGELDGLHVSVS